MSFFAKILGKNVKKYTPISKNVKILDDDKCSDVVHTVPIVVTPPSQRYIIKIDGKYDIYNSLEEMDSELRKEIESIEHFNTMSSFYTVIINGKRQSYSKFEDIPEEIRNAVADTSREIEKI